jgi:hypothetical protein
MNLDVYWIKMNSQKSLSLSSRKGEEAKVNKTTQVIQIIEKSESTESLSYDCHRNGLEETAEKGW